MGLILAVIVAVVVVARQICRNRIMIEKLVKIKERLDRRFSEMETKGKKVGQEDRFEELQQER